MSSVNADRMKNVPPCSNRARLRFNLLRLSVESKRKRFSCISWHFVPKDKLAKFLSTGQRAFKRERKIIVYQIISQFSNHFTWSFVSRYFDTRKNLSERSFYTSSQSFPISVFRETHTINLLQFGPKNIFIHYTITAHQIFIEYPIDRYTRSASDGQ